MTISLKIIGGSIENFETFARQTSLSVGGGARPAMTTLTDIAGVRFKLCMNYHKIGDNYPSTTQGFELIPGEYSESDNPAWTFPVRGLVETREVIGDSIFSSYASARDGDTSSLIFTFHSIADLLVDDVFFRPLQFLRPNGFYRWTVSGNMTTRTGTVAAVYNAITPTWRKIDDGEEQESANVVGNANFGDAITTRVTISALNGRVSVDGNTLLLTPDVFGTWETVEDVVIGLSMPNEYVGYLTSRNTLDPVPDAPIEIIGKYQVTITDQQ